MCVHLSTLVSSPLSSLSSSFILFPSVLPSALQIKGHLSSQSIRFRVGERKRERERMASSKVDEIQVAPKENPSGDQGSSSSSVQKEKEIDPKEVMDRLSRPLDRKPSGRQASESEGLPEWKLKCLNAEYGVPPNLRGSLHIGGCF